MNLFKKSPPTTTYPLMSGEEVCYNVIVSEKKVEFQSAAKDWSVSFTNTTQEYIKTKVFINADRLDLLILAVRAMFEARNMLFDIKLIAEFAKSLIRWEKRILREAALRPKTQSDAEILAEDKVLHEKTAESIAELEAIKNEKK